jgi:hypothetical protein
MLRVSRMPRRPLVAQHFSLTWWLFQLLVSFGCASIGCSRQSETETGKNTRFGVGGLLLADPLSPPTASATDLAPRVYDALPSVSADSRADAVREARCPRRVERGIQIDCEGGRTNDELTRIWTYWRMCADVSGANFGDADEVHMRVAIRGGRGNVASVKKSNGVPSAVVSCLSAAVRATDFRQPKPCELDLLWSPLPTGACRPTEAQ